MFLMTTTENNTPYMRVVHLVRADSLVKTVVKCVFNTPAAVVPAICEHCLLHVCTFALPFEFFRLCYVSSWGTIARFVTAG